MTAAAAAAVPLPGAPVTNFTVARGDETDTGSGRIPTKVVRNMTITRETLVHKAFNSSPQAPEIFAAHGVRPSQKCQVVWDEVSLDDAEMWCHLKDVDSMMVELNAACGGTQAPAPPQHAS